MKDWKVVCQLGGTTLVAFALSGCGGSGNESPPSEASPVPPVATTPVAQPVSCSQLAGTAIPPSAFRLSTSGGVVTTASVVAASGTGAAAVPEHCLVNGAVMPVDKTAPEIRFRVALPTNWNTKAVMFWLFGGNNQFGTASLAYYNGSSLAVNEDVVVVVINYRTNSTSGNRHLIDSHGLTFLQFSASRTHPPDRRA
ncbi:MAG: hypothetical protein EOO81_04535, partial [Oxalobacteraceae bacterium]